jgi:NADPH2:quinone reductase
MLRSSTVNESPSRGLSLRTLVTDEGEVRLYLEEVDVAAPGPGEVLIRIEAAPINPSDMGLLFAGADPSAMTSEDGVTVGALSPGLARASRARWGNPLPAGNEGAGTVIAAGPDAEALVGKVVGLAGGSMYSQYRIARASDCMVMPEGVSAEQAASCFVNPLTVLGFIETMRAEGHPAVVHTAAASNLGQMLQRVCIEEQVPLVNVVRSDAQADILRALGAAHVVDSSRDDFMEQLTAAVKQTGATVAFDAIGGGSIGSRILTAMEIAFSEGASFSRYGSNVHKQLYIYGGLDRGPTELTRSFGFAWSAGGWLLTPFLMKSGPEVLERMRKRVVDGITTTFASSYTDAVDLPGMLSPSAIAVYGRQATGKKYLLRPN